MQNCPTAGRLQAVTDKDWLGTEQHDGVQLTGLFMNLRVISRASGGRVAENTPTCNSHEMEYMKRLGVRLHNLQTICT